MSSPCKRIKLTPKKERDASGLRYTQESKITSTPQRRSGRISTPDISRISSTGSSDRTTLLSNASNQNHTDSCHEESSSSSTSRSSTPFSTIGSEKSGVIAVENYDTYINQSNRIKYTGKVWQLHKPSQDGTLYTQILQEPQNIQEVVTELLLLYNRRPERAICALLKFCIDVCGYQNFEVADHYNFQTNVTKRVIEIMESNRVLAQQEVLISTGRYLLKEPATGLAQLLKISIYSFLQKLVISAHERGILYDDFFAKHFFMFVKCMSFSQISAIRHTGVVFGIKILTAVVMVYDKIQNDESSDSSENTELQKQEINNYLEFFYLIFVKNCRLQDNKLTLMRVECIYEVSIWVRYFPKIFITQLQTVNYLLKLISDYSKDVRFAALETCEAFVGTPNILSVLKSSFPDFAEYIGKRFYDIDIKVGVKAIDIFRILLKHGSSFISTNRFKIIMSLVFDEHFLIGEAASKFLISYLGKSENNQEILLLNLAKFSMKPGDAIKQLLVEGCLSYCLALRNWRLFFNIFLHSDIELDIKKHLAELFAESVHQVLIGKSTIMRNKSRKVTIGDPDEHTKVASYFPIFPTLLEKYMDYPQILLEFLKIITTVKDTVLDEVCTQTVKKILSTMEDLFYYHNDDTLLKKLSDTFYYFSNVTTHADYVQQVVEKVFLKYKTDLVVNLNNQSEEIRNITSKLSVLFANFDLSQKFQWETLFDNWGDVDEVSTANLMSCCKWYIIWSLKNVTTTNYATQTPTLTRACKEFTSTCFNMLQNLKGQPLHLKTYECLCDIYITYTNELEELTKSFKQMAKLKLVIEDVQLQNVLITFLEKHVISSTTMPVFERQSYIVKYINLVHVNVLSIKCLGNIFRYYHMYNKEYGAQIESSLSDITKVDEITFLMVVLYTLTMVYEHILNKYGAVDLATQDARNFKLLIKQFLNLKVFKTPNKFLKLIYFAINYSVKDESKYAFLYFVRYFADLIVEENDKKDVLSFFKNKVPKDAEKNDAVLFLANYLKNLKSGNTAGNSKPTHIARKSKENIKPKKKTDVSRQRSRPSLEKKSKTVKAKRVTEKTKKQINVDTETDVSDDLTIHDSESDDLEESFTVLRV